MAKPRQLLIGSDAVTIKKQHRLPCSDCPWSRKSLRGWLGPLTAEEWLKKAHGDGIIECHTRITEDSNLQCAGAAIFRDNICKLPRNREALVFPHNTKLVFANGQEFMEHHKLNREDDED